MGNINTNFVEGGGNPSCWHQSALSEGVGLFGVLLLVIFGSTGCGKTPPKSSLSSQSSETSSSGYVQLDFSEAEEELELMYATELLMATAKCGDLVRLEPAAMMGRLSGGEVRCLERALKNAELQTVMDKISRVLMSDAWAKGEKTRWETIVRRHLTQIERADPDLCYLFAAHLVKDPPDKMDEVLKWTKVALENKGIWSGNLHVKRVHGLYRLQALASNKKWAWLERNMAQYPSAELQERVDETRSLTKNYAKEWLDYATSVQRDTTEAKALCESAAGSKDFCGGQ